MAKKKVELRKVFLPSDSIAFIAIGVGLVIAVVAPFDNLAVRLIGICIAILGGVALFMMVSPRLTDLQIITPVRPSSTPDITSRTVQDAKKRTQTFDPDAYRESFGQSEGEEQPFFDENQTALFEDVSAERSEALNSNVPIAPVELISDADSSVRIVGTRKSSGPAVPTLVSEARQAARRAQLQELTGRRTAVPPATSAPFTGDITEEIHLSDDVIIRPVRSAAPPTPALPVAEVPDPLHDVAADAGGAGEPIALAASTESVSDLSEPSVSEHENVDDSELLAEEFGDAYEVPADVQEAAAIPAPPRETSRRSPSVSLSTFVNDSNEEDLASQEPRREFDYLLNRVLMVIRSATNARTAAFLWVNSERQELVVEAKITEAEDEFTSQRKLPMGIDALSQIAREGRPEIITQISPSAEMELLPYYARAAGTVSFIGVPVYYGGNVVGILCADSKIEDAYSDITVGFFGQFTKLISGLVSSYTSKYDLMLASAKLEAMEHLRQALSEAPASVQNATRALFGTLIQHMDVSRIGLVSYDAASGGWALTDARSAMDDNYRSLVGSAVDVRNTDVGSCITTASSVVLTNETVSTRVVASEPPLEYGQFVAVPLRTSNECFGAVFLENLEASLTAQDVALAEALAEHVASLFEQLHHAQSLKGAALLDHATGVLNGNGFEMRIREEFARSVDYNIPLTVCMLHLDASRATPEQRMYALLHVLRLVKDQLRDYDVVARVGDEQIALGLIGYKLQEAQNWTETMRREVASSPVDVQGKRLSFTASIGIAQAEPRDTWDDLVAHAQAALDVSMRSGNKVTVFA